MFAKLIILWYLSVFTENKKAFPQNNDMLLNREPEFGESVTSSLTDQPPTQSPDGSTTGAYVDTTMPGAVG